MKTEHNLSMLVLSIIEFKECLDDIVSLNESGWEELTPEIILKDIEETVGYLDEGIKRELK